MATATQRTRFRLNLGLDDDETVFTNTEVDDIFVEAAEEHTSPAKLKVAYALVIGAKRLKRKAATLADYTANDSSEKLSQVFKNLDSIYKDVLADYTVLLEAQRPKMRVAVPTKKPARKVEWPDA
jgi:hypothetical protein